MEFHCDVRRRVRQWVGYNLLGTVSGFYSVTVIWTVLERSLTQVINKLSKGWILLLLMFILLWEFYCWVISNSCSRNIVGVDIEFASWDIFDSQHRLQMLTRHLKTRSHFLNIVWNFFLYEWWSMNTDHTLVVDQVFRIFVAGPTTQSKLDLQNTISLSGSGHSLIWETI